MRCSKCVEKLSYFSFLAKSYGPKQQVKYLINNTYQYLQHSTYSTSFFNIQTDLLFVHDLIYFFSPPCSSPALCPQKKNGRRNQKQSFRTSKWFQMETKKAQMHNGKLKLRKCQFQQISSNLYIKLKYLLYHFFKLFEHKFSKLNL